MNENQACPPALSHMGMMRHGTNMTKFDLVGCLEDLAPPQENAAAASPAAEFIIFDGAAITNILPTGTANTFNEYARQQVLPYITSQLQGGCCLR